MKFKKLTATSLIFDGSNGTFGPPIDGFRQLVAVVNGVSATGVLVLHDSSSRGRPDPQIRSPILVVGQIGEPVQSNLIRPILRVMVIDEVQILPEDLKPLLLFFDSVVGLAKLRQPQVVGCSHLAVTPAAEQRGGGEGGSGKEEEGEEGKQRGGRRHGEGWLKKRDDC